MRVVYRDTNIWEEILVTTSNDIAGLLAIFKVSKKVTIKQKDYVVNEYRFRYDENDKPELYIELL
ncbi:hypothetical protein [Bacillus anthracis]|uniref:hypothetical protein n=1 Tax=Bacillus anthracis TaxID=1392 RepID=UPI002DB70BB9|nr:hypothetical protein [Bacillus anthracis]MEB9454202.1 hypothetical protein [Bacillus anthracis]